MITTPPFSTHLSLSDEVFREALEATERAIQYQAAQIAVGVTLRVKQSGSRAHTPSP